MTNFSRWYFWTGWLFFGIVSHPLAGTIYVGQPVTKHVELLTSDHHYFHLQCQFDQVDLGQLLDGNRWFSIFDHFHFWNTGSGSNNPACKIFKVWFTREILSIFRLEEFQIFKILFSRPLPVNVVFKDIFSIWNFVFAPENGLKPQHWRFLFGKVTLTKRVLWECYCTYGLATFFKFREIMNDRATSALPAG